MWYVILQTKATKSRRDGGRPRGTVWTTEHDPKVHVGLGRADFVAQMLKCDGGEGEVLAEFRSGGEMHAAMLRWHRLLNKAVADGAFPAGGKASNDFACTLARAAFKKYGGGA